VTIEIRDPQGNVVQEVVTDSNGDYSVIMRFPKQRQNQALSGR